MVATAGERGARDSSDEEEEDGDVGSGEGSAILRDAIHMWI
jgi:hypothetical protein